MVSPALAVLADVTGQPLEESLADFWSPGLSQARLRATPPSPATPPDLLLRLSEPPPALVRGQQLRDLLTPAYTALAAAQDESAQSLGVRICDQNGHEPTLSRSGRGTSRGRPGG
jgi:hypothetical protein